LPNLTKGKTTDQGKNNSRRERVPKDRGGKKDVKKNGKVGLGAVRAGTEARPERSKAGDPQLRQGAKKTAGRAAGRKKKLNTWA